MKGFYNIRKQREDNIVKLSYQKRRFISQLNKQDRKFEAVKKFQLDYNLFIQENRDMVEEGQTKEELEMTTAINTEKAVFRYRINILKQFAKQ